MATQIPPGKPKGDPKKPGNGRNVVKDVELLRVLIAREGKKVSAQWSVHPQLKQDLQAEEWKEVSELMRQVTEIVGGRFSEILSETEPDKPGTA